MVVELLDCGGGAIRMWLWSYYVVVVELLGCGGGAIMLWWWSY